MKRLVVFLPLIVLLAAVALFGLFGLGRDTQVSPDAMVGKPMPKIEAPLLSGGPPVDVGSLIEGPTLVNTFGSWCEPCIQEAPFLDELKARGARIVGLAQRDDPADTAEFLTRYGNPFVVVLDDREMKGFVEFGATGVPETFVVDSSGVIVDKHTGPLLSEADVERLMAALRKAK